MKGQRVVGCFLVSVCLLLAFASCTQLSLDKEEALTVDPKDMPSGAKWHEDRNLELAASDVSTNGGLLVYKGDNLPDIQVGDLIVHKLREPRSKYYLLEVVKVGKDGELLSADTKQGNMLKLFPENASVDINSERMAMSVRYVDTRDGMERVAEIPLYLEEVYQVDEEGNEVVVYQEDAQIEDAARWNYEKKYTPTGWYKTYSDTLSFSSTKTSTDQVLGKTYSYNMTTTSSASIVFNSSLKINPWFGVKFTGSGWDLDYFKGTANLCTDAKVEVTATANGSLNGSYSKRVISGQTVCSFTSLWPPVRIRLIYDANILVTASGTASTSVKFGANVYFNGECGIEWNDGNWNQIKNSSYKFNWITPTVYTAPTSQLVVTPMLRNELTILLYEVGGPGLAITPYVQGTLKASSPNYSLVGGVKGGVYLRLAPFGKTLASTQDWQLFNFTKTLTSGDINSAYTPTTYTGEVSDKGTLIFRNDILSSFKVVNGYCGGRVILYDDDDYCGDRQTFIASDRKLDGQSVGNDSASSLKVIGPCYVRLYEHTDFGGSTLTFSAAAGETLYIPDLSDYGWDDKVSSIRVKCNSRGVVFHGGGNYTENAHIFFTSKSDLGATDWDGRTCHNDAMSSAQVVGECYVTWYEHDDYEGDSITLQSTAYNDSYNYTLQWEGGTAEPEKILW